MKSFFSKQGTDPGIGNRFGSSVKFNSPFRLTISITIAVGLACLWFSISVNQLAASADSVVVFNEIQYHPADGGTEWIELRNLMGVQVDLSGWRLAGGIDLVFKEGTRMAGRGWLVVAADPEHVSLKAQEIYPTAFTGRLNNSGDSIRLENKSGRVMDRLDYRDAGEWPTGPDGSGATLAKRNEDTADSRPQNWRASMELGGTPGQPNQKTIDSSAIEIPLVSLNSEWKYKADKEASPLNWKKLDFDDQDWATGKGVFHSGQVWSGSIGEGPSGYWPLDKGNGIRAHNLAGEPDGRLRNGPKWVTDPIRGTVIEFDGINDYVSTGVNIPQINLENDFTWAFWAYSNNPGNVNVIVGNRTGPTGADFSPREFIKFTNAAFEFHRASSGEDIDYVDFPINAWAHHAITKKGAQLTYYRDGVSMGNKLSPAG